MVCGLQLRLMGQAYLTQSWPLRMERIKVNTEQEAGRLVAGLKRILKTGL